MFDGKKFLTPDRGVLGGITRKVVLELVESRFPLERRDILLTELLAAEELFLCSSNKEVVPVVQADDAVIGSGKPGRNTAAVMALFTEYTHTWATGSTPQR
jgi:branched-chain amino acid aminotransferase